MCVALVVHRGRAFTHVVYVAHEGRFTAFGCPGCGEDCAGGRSNASVATQNLKKWTVLLFLQPLRVAGCAALGFVGTGTSRLRVTDSRIHTITCIYKLAWRGFGKVQGVTSQVCVVRASPAFVPRAGIA